VLLAHEVGRGNVELEVLRTLSAEHPVGITLCWRCAREAPGWPRFCVDCEHDHAGVPAAEQGPAGSVQNLRESLERKWPGARLLGSIPYASGEGVMHFVQRATRSRRSRQAGPAPVIGVVIDRNAHGALIAVPCWAMDRASLEGFRASLAEAAVQSDEPQSVDSETPAEEGDEKDPPRHRPQIWWAAAVLLLTAIVSIPYITRRDRPVPGPVPIDTTIAYADTITRDSGIAAPAPVDTTLGEDGTRRRRRGLEPVDTAATQDTFVPPPPPRDPEVDREEVRSLAEGFATAYGTANIEQVRTAYPGISATEDAEWAGWFSDNPDVETGYILNRGPDVRGDSATINFTLIIKYPNGLRCRVLDGTTVRSMGTWSLQRLTGSNLSARICRNLYRNHGTR
jgi:hypothetical protein